MPKLKLSEADQEILVRQVIDAERPGPILHDFGVVLEYIGLGGVKANGKYNLLPIEAIPILDDRLSRPLRLAMKRPQLRSHPYLQAIHMLLRATGLTRVETLGGVERLVVDSGMLDQWHNLNPTEQYFTLFEAAFVHAMPEMIGEHGRGFSGFLSTCVAAWQRLPAKGKRFDLKQPAAVYVMDRKLYLVALVDLFGLMEVEHPTFPVQPWVPAALRHAPFGDAMFELICQAYLQFAVLDREERPDSTGIWQRHFQPYFQEWRATLRLPEPEFREGVFHFKVSLGSMWREIAIADRMNLDDLAYAILDAVDFESDHLYEFSYRDHLGRMATASHEECDEGACAIDCEIGALPLMLGQSMTFLFDFGDSWRFDVKLEKVAPPNPRMKKPKVVAKRGAAPEQYPDSEW